MLRGLLLVGGMSRVEFVGPMAWRELPIYRPTVQDYADENVEAAIVAGPRRNEMDVVTAALPRGDRLLAAADAGRRSEVAIAHVFARVFAG